MEIRTASADFSSPLRGSGPRTASQAVIFPRAVQQAAVGLLGYSVAYGDNDDHHVGLIEIKVDPVINDNVVTVNATLGLRDWSGDWDDDYLGTIQFAVMADLVAITEPPPRGDVIVTGIECNQAVQFFRSANYLDATQALPDNAIRLVSRKNTGFRVYVDYDQYAGLPLISNLTGQMTVQTGATTMNLDPINSGGAITPRPDASINPAVANHTLNFMLPAVWCSGTVTISVQVWDQADPSKKSAVFLKTLTFADAAPLDLFVVGVNYTAQGLNLAAPTLSDITNAMSQLRKTYPVGDISINGYATLAYGENVNFTIGSGGGCGSGMDDLLDTLDDMQGGSSDIYAAFLPNLGLIQTPGSNIGGCGTTGQAAIFIDQVGDVPHEVGHALGRQHAPCSQGVCNPMPANVDDHYPQYGSFPAGSIGVFGFDPTSNQALDPSATADFMAYWGPQWVSAYTYMALGGAFPSTGGGGGGLANGHALTNVPVETLHLHLEVSRERHVRREVAFHFESLARPAPRCGEFTVELLDECRRTLVCAPIDCGCSRSSCHCWPRKMRGSVPYPPNARWLVVYDHDCMIYEECIPRPPQVTITDTSESGNGYEIAWTAQDPTAKGDPGKGREAASGFEYVVHWWDAEAEVWRGVAPRTSETSIVVPPEIYRRGGARIRVLASSGIATGYAEVEVTPKKPAPGRTSVSLAGAGAGARAVAGAGATHVIHAVAVDEQGRQADLAGARWYAHDGAEIGRGAELDLRPLPPGHNRVRIVFQDASGAFVAKSWLIDREPGGRAVCSEVEETHRPQPRKPHHHPHAKPRAKK